MGDLYHYPVFFKCQNLPQEHKKKIERYFQIHRLSGGGDCGELTSVGDGVYRISFRNKEDQQAVLQRSKHVVPFEDGSLTFTVRGSPEPSSTFLATSSTARAGALQPVSALTHLPRGEDYAFQCDSYLLRYLVECPMAQTEMERKLASLSCSVQLFPDEEKVSVKRSAVPAAADEVRGWKAEVDKVFDCYTCQHEINPQRVKGLLHCSRLGQIPDDVKVYMDEQQIAVVVGKCSRVNTLFLNIDELCVCGNLASLSEESEESEESKENTIVARYSIGDVIEVLVCEGDITKQSADALVNAANENLSHGGGVAAALSKAAGPEVQKECRKIVKQCGKIDTGEVVASTGGNLKCKILLHAVGPVAGKSGGKERQLLKKTVWAALDLAESMELESIAMPCISSGLFGVPVTVCCEAIVMAVQEFGCQGARSLNNIILIDNKQDVVRALQEACDNLLQGDSTTSEALSDLAFQDDVADQDMERGATAEAAGDSVNVEVIEGTIETQQVDAVVCPMVHHDPFSTRIGNVLYELAGQQVAAEFRQEGGKETVSGDSVLVEGLPGLQSDAVFFLNLVPWHGDSDGRPVQVLRMGINGILSACENKGFNSVAFPVLGTGIALKFPVNIVEKVLMEEIHAFGQQRTSSTPLLVRIVIHPNDKESKESIETFKCDWEGQKSESQSEDLHQEDQDKGLTPKRIVLVGKTGSGKSHLANTIFGEKLFTTDASANSGTSKCQAETRTVNGQSITLIDTPGLFDTGKSEEDLKPEIISCITECAPGPHAFFIVLKVDKFSEQEQAVITKLCDYFSDDALEYAVVVFTHGDQLSKGKKIEDFVSQNEKLSDLVRKCGGRCHVFDNKLWNNKQANNYRSNQFQLERLLSTVDTMVMEKNGGHYTNKFLEETEKKIQEEVEHLSKSENLPKEEIREKAKTKVSNDFLTLLAGTATGVLLGAFCGIAAMVTVVITAVRTPELMKLVKQVPALTGAAAVGAEVAAAATAVVGVASVAAGGVWGGAIGHDAAVGARTPLEAAERAADAVIKKGTSFFRQSR